MQPLDEQPSLSHLRRPLGRDLRCGDALDHVNLLRAAIVAGQCRCQRRDKTIASDHCRSGDTCFRAVRQYCGSLSLWGRRRGGVASYHLARGDTLNPSPCSAQGRCPRRWNFPQSTRIRSRKGGRRWVFSNICWGQATRTLMMSSRRHPRAQIPAWIKGGRRQKLKRTCVRRRDNTILSDCFAPKK